MCDVSVKILLPDLCGVVSCDLDLKTVRGCVATGLLFSTVFCFRAFQMPFRKAFLRLLSSGLCGRCERHCMTLVPVSFPSRCSFGMYFKRNCCSHGVCFLVYLLINLKKNLL